VCRVRLLGAWWRYTSDCRRPVAGGSARTRWWVLSVGGSVRRVPHMEDEELGGSAKHPAWLLGFEARDANTVICIQCGAVVVKSATYASRHREWHVRSGV
jgi:hypothetical protein